MKAHADYSTGSKSRDICRETNVCTIWDILKPCCQKVWTKTQDRTDLARVYEDDIDRNIAVETCHYEANSRMVA